MCASRLTRRAASVLLRISLVSVLSSPKKVDHCMSATAAISVNRKTHILPVSSNLCSLCSDAHDGRLVLTVDASPDSPLPHERLLLPHTHRMRLAAALYCSLLLTVKFRGEFGVLAEDAAVDLDEVGDASDSLLQSEFSRSASGGGTDGGVSDVFRIPLVDLRHMIALFPGKKKSSRDNALSARLFSLKVDVKDA